MMENRADLCSFNLTDKDKTMPGSFVGPTPDGKYQIIFTRSDLETLSNVKGANISHSRQTSVDTTDASRLHEMTIDTKKNEAKMEKIKTKYLIRREKHDSADGLEENATYTIYVASVVERCAPEKNTFTLKHGKRERRGKIFNDSIINSKNLSRQSQSDMLDIEATRTSFDGSKDGQRKEKTIKDESNVILSSQKQTRGELFKLKQHMNKHQSKDKRQKHSFSKPLRLIDHLVSKEAMSSNLDTITINKTGMAKLGGKEFSNKYTTKEYEYQSSVEIDELKRSTQTNATNAKIKENVNTITLSRNNECDFKSVRSGTKIEKANSSDSYTDSYSDKSDDLTQKSGSSSDTSYYDREKETEMTNSPPVSTKDAMCQYSLPMELQCMSPCSCYCHTSVREAAFGPEYASFVSVVKQRLVNEETYNGHETQEHSRQNHVIDHSQLSEDTNDIRPTKYIRKCPTNSHFSKACSKGNNTEKLPVLPHVSKSSNRNGLTKRTANQLSRYTRNSWPGERPLLYTDGVENGRAYQKYEDDCYSYMKSSGILVSSKHGNNHRSMNNGQYDEIDDTEDKKSNGENEEYVLVTTNSEVDKKNDIESCDDKRYVFESLQRCAIFKKDDLMKHDGVENYVSCLNQMVESGSIKKEENAKEYESIPYIDETETLLSAVFDNWEPVEAICKNNSAMKQSSKKPTERRNSTSFRAMVEETKLQSNLNRSGNFLDEKYNRKSGEESGHHFIGDYLLKLWKKQVLCDVKVNVGNTFFLVHKLVLAAFSDVFTPINPYPEPSLQFTVPCSCPEAVYRVFNYIYTASMDVEDDKLEDILHVGIFLGINEIKDVVLEILSQPTIENVGMYIDIRNRCGIPTSLLDYPVLYRHNLMGLIEQEKFKELTVEELESILRDPGVLVETETDTLRAVATWAQYNPLTRLSEVPRLLDYIIFEVMSPDSIASIVQLYDPIFSEAGARNKIAEVYRFHALQLANAEKGIQNVEEISGIEKDEYMDRVSYIPSQNSIASSKRRPIKSLSSNDKTRYGLNRGNMSSTKSITKSMGNLPSQRRKSVTDSPFLTRSNSARSLGGVKNPNKSSNKYRDRNENRGNRPRGGSFRANKSNNSKLKQDNGEESNCCSTEEDIFHEADTVNMASNFKEPGNQIENGFKMKDNVCYETVCNPSVIEEENVKDSNQMCTCEKHQGLFRQKYASSDTASNKNVYDKAARLNLLTNNREVRKDLHQIRCAENSPKASSSYTRSFRTHHGRTSRKNFWSKSSFLVSVEDKADEALLGQFVDAIKESDADT